MFFGLSCYWYLSVSVNRLISMGTQQTVFADKETAARWSLCFMVKDIRKVIYSKPEKTPTESFSFFICNICCWDKLH